VARVSEGPRAVAPEIPILEQVVQDLQGAPPIPDRARACRRSLLRQFGESVWCAVDPTLEAEKHRRLSSTFLGASKNGRAVLFLELRDNVGDHRVIAIRSDLVIDSRFHSTDRPEQLRH
jgi:hypothetical protein